MKNTIIATKNVLTSLQTKRLTSIEFGLIPSEVEYGHADPASEGLNGEIRFGYEGKQWVHLSWIGPPGFLSITPESTWNNLSYVAPKGDYEYLCQALFQKVRAAHLFGKNSIPLAVQFVFDNIILRAGTYYEDSDWIYIKPSLSAIERVEDEGLQLLWSSSNNA